MAVTSIWSIKGWIGKVINYAENPDKTKENNEGRISENQSRSIQGLNDVITYAVNAEKIRRRQSESMEMELVGEAEELMEQYVSGVNCAPTTAREEMIAVKKRFGKEDGIVAFHGYQSFAPGECNPAMAHEIGKKLAEELWGSQYQVLIATHLDKANHLHNHFVVNSVSFLDGKRYHRTNQDYRDMRMVSDRLCKEYQLSVVGQPEQGKGKHYAEWQAEQQGKPSYHSMVKADVDEAIRKARTEKQFFFYLREKGYLFKFGKDITIRPEGRERGLKLKRNFGENYSLEAIRVRILEENELPAEKKFPVQRHYRIRVSGNFKQTRKIGGLRGLYLHYCYLLGILPKNRPSMSAKQIHVLFREDLLKLNTISKETKLLCHYHIDTAEQLFSLKESLQKKTEQCVEERKHLRYKIRADRPEEEIQEMKEQIKVLTEKIGTLRKKVALCDGIAARSKVIEEKFKMVREEKEKKKTKGRVRLETLVKSGRPRTVFSVKESDLKQFVQEAKRYGVLYCAVRNPKGSSDGLVDVIVKEEDAPRINRIVDRFQFASVTEAAKIKTEIERTRAEKAKAGKSEKQEKKPEKVQVQQEKQGQAEPEKDYPQKSKEDQLMDELFGEPVKKEGKEQNPSLAKTTKSRLSEPTSKRQEKTAEGTSKLFTPEKPEKPSVRKELREIQNARKKEAERRENRNDPVRNQGNKDRNQIRHQQPQQKRKPRKGKER